MKKVLFIIGAFLLVSALAGGVVYFVTSKDPSPEEVFRKYLQTSAASKTVDADNSYSGSGSTENDQGSLDTDAKKMMLSGAVTCDATIDEKSVKLNVTAQQENTSLYLRLDDASGDIVANDGTPVNLANTFSKVKGVWYKVTDEYPTTKAQLDSGVYIFNSAVVAPSYDTTKVVDTLIGKNAITFTSAQKEGDNYVYAVTSNKAAFLDALKELFPNLASPDLVLDEVFGDETILNSTLTVSMDGVWSTEKLSQPNSCTDMVDTFIGLEATGLAKEVTGVATAKPKGSIVITPVTGAKPIEDMQNDFVF